MKPLAARVDAAVRGVAPGLVSVSIGDPADRTSWKVHPAALQAAVQATINAFNPTDPALDDADLDAEAAGILDADRILSALWWVLSPAPTKAKYQAARAQWIAAYRARPWF